MSTYTDLHNKIKETIVVNYNDRKTAQAVKFLNENNEYWGKFDGVIGGENSLISNTVLVDATLSTGCSIGGVNLGEIGANILELSSKTNDLSINIDSISNDINFLSDGIDNIQIKVDESLSSIGDILSGASDLSSAIDEIEQNINGITFKYVDTLGDEHLEFDIPGKEDSPIKVSVATLLSAGQIVDVNLTSETDENKLKRLLNITFLDINNQNKTVTCDISDLIDKYYGDIESPIIVNKVGLKNNEYKIGLDIAKARVQLGIEDIEHDIGWLSGSMDGTLNSKFFKLIDPLGRTFENGKGVVGSTDISGNIRLFGNIESIPSLPHDPDNTNKNHKIKFPNGEFDNLTSKKFNVEGLSSKNLIVDNLSATTLSASNLSATEVSSESLSVTNLSSEKLSADDLSATVGKIVDLTASNITGDNITVDKINFIKQIVLDHISGPETMNMYKIVQSYNLLVESLASVFNFNLNVKPSDIVEHTGDTITGLSQNYKIVNVPSKIDDIKINRIKNELK